MHLEGIMATSVPRLLDHLRNTIGLGRYSIRIEEAYVDWARRTFAHLRGMPAERKALARRIDALRERMQSDEPAGTRPTGFVAPAPD